MTQDPAGKRQWRMQARRPRPYAFGNYPTCKSYDHAVLDEGLTYLTGFHNPAWPAAVILDADRRGLRFVDFSRAIVAVLERAPDSECREILADIARSALGSPIANLDPDPLLVALVQASDLVDVSNPFSTDREASADVLIDATLSFSREGFTLNWLSRKAAQLAGVEWTRVVAEADRLLLERRTGRIAVPTREAKDA